MQKVMYGYKRFYRDLVGRLEGPYSGKGYIGSRGVLRYNNAIGFVARRITRPLRQCMVGYHFSTERPRCYGSDNVIYRIRAMEVERNRKLICRSFKIIRVVESKSRKK